MITPKITNLGYSNLWTDMSTILGYASNSQKLITKLFANGEQGFFYDPSDLSTMFQDTSGTIPVTAAGQPIGLIRDKSGRNNRARQTTSASRPIFQQKPILGDNFVTDSTLAEPSKWNTGVASGISVSDNKLIFNNVTAYHASVTSALNSAKLTVGKRYLLSYIISGYVSGAVRAQLTGGAIISTTSFNKNGSSIASYYCYGKTLIHRFSINGGRDYVKYIRSVLAGDHRLPCSSKPHQIRWCR